MSWKFSLTSLMTFILVIIPLCVSLLLAVGGGSHCPNFSRKRELICQSFTVLSNARRPLFAPRLCLSIIPVALYLFALSKIPLPSALSDSFTVDTFTAALSRLIVLGTIILGLLSGFGAISNSWGYIPLLTRSK